MSFTSSGSLPIPHVIDNSQMESNEAAASVSDDSGNLLFYTNGVTVWNNQHAVMINGNNIGGHMSACQVLIIPQVDNDSLYYIFTTDAVENNFQTGYRYSIVNMNRGEVISKNNLLWQSCTERLTAARHANGIDIWLITNDNNSNIFRAWLINCNGIAASPVISTVGAVLNSFDAMNAGVMKVSPDGKYLCQTHFPDYDLLINPPNFIQLFDFDNATGIISNTRTIGFPNTNTEYTHAEFSPDSRQLYATRPYEKRIDQFDITVPTSAAIIASRIVFPVNAGFFAIQLAPDEKLYLAHPSTYLGAINFPNVRGTGCNLAEQQVNLTPGSAYLGLPSYINDGAVPTNPNNGFSFIITDSCIGQVQFNGFTNMAGPLTWEWDFGDGNTSAQQNPVHTFNPANQAYTVRLTVRSSLVCGSIQRSRLVKPQGVINNVDFEIIKRCDSGYVRFVNKNANLQGMPGQWSWDFGDGNTSTDIDPIHSYAQSGLYNVKLKFTTANPCFDDSLVLPLDMQTFQITISPDQTIMIGQSLQLFANGPATKYQWTPSLGLNNPDIRTPVASPLEDIVYTVTASDADGCKTQDSVRITVLQYNDIYLPSGFTPNNDGKNDIIRPFFGARYTLSDFSVFTRWGQSVFSTHERGKGWDGKINGTMQPAGVYVWQIQAIDKSGVSVERKGTFVLIR
jgi:gliding motility-associated-like protein